MRMQLTRRPHRRQALAAAGGALAAFAASTETSAMSNPELLSETLFAAGPHPSLGSHAETYGWLVGSWEGEFRDNIGSDETNGAMEVHFGWVLQGLAIQDTWIAPTRAERARGSRSTSRDTYGTTLRLFDPAIQAWRIFWFNPARGLIRSELVGRRVGADIIQQGMAGDTPTQWNFTDITPRSFTWRALLLDPDGVNWRLTTEFRLRRE
jgi:hypothetical protein